MYQLTLTFTSGQQMADVIADLANNHRELRIAIHLDEMISPDHPEYVPTSADRFSAETISRDAQIMRDVKSAVQAGIERTQPRKPARLTKADAKAKAAYRKAKLAREAEAVPVDDKWWQRDERARAVANAVKQLGCPRCFVGKGQPCLNKLGEPRHGWAHSERMLAVHQGLTVEDMQDKMAMRDELHDSIRRIFQTVSCRKCHSPQGHACVTAGGHKMGHYVHKQRREDYNDIQAGAL